MSEYRKYPARLVRVVDGDTYDMEIDVGFGIRFSDRFRHDQVDTWEMFGVEKDRGRITKTAVELWWLDRDDGAKWPFEARIVQTKHGSDKRGKYGRWLVEVFSGIETLGDFLTSGEYESWPLAGEV